MTPGKGDRYLCAIDECRKIFVELNIFWRLCLLGFVALLGLGGTVFAWSTAVYRDDKAYIEKRIEVMESSWNEIQYLRSQSNEILDNQRKILKYFEGKRK